MKLCVRLLLLGLLGLFTSTCNVSNSKPDTITLHLNDSLKASSGKYDTLQIDVDVINGQDTSYHQIIFHDAYTDSTQLINLPLPNLPSDNFIVILSGYHVGAKVLVLQLPFSSGKPGQTKLDTLVVDSVVAVTSVQASTRNLTLQKGGSPKEIFAKVLPAKISQAVLWTSTASGVATVHPKTGDSTHALVSPVGLGQSHIVVASQKDPSKTDTVFVTVVDSGTLSSNANLSTLTVSSGTLNSPAFSPTNRVSGESVANSVDSIKVTATVADTTAHLTINGKAVPSGTASDSFGLKVGVDSIFVVVTAQDATQKTYVIAIARAAPNASSNANLSVLAVSSGTLNDPAFNPAFQVFGESVANGVSSIRVVATVADTTAHLTINGTSVPSGTASDSIGLSVGVDSIFILVTAPDGSQKKYFIVIMRAKSSNANLSGLAVSSGTLNNPAFNPASRVSGESVVNSVDSIKVTATLADTSARLTINGKSVPSGTASDSIGLNVGVDSIFIVVTAQDATQKTYAIGITRVKSSNANLSTLTVSSGTLNNPAFNPNNLSSGESVANSDSSITLTVTVADTTASLSINAKAEQSGSASGPIPLSVGVNSILIVVKAQDGTQKVYTVKITRTL